MDKIKLENRSRELLLQIYERDPYDCLLPHEDEYCIQELEKNGLIDALGTKDGFYCNMTSKGILYIKQNPSLKNPHPIRIRRISAHIAGFGADIEVK